MTRHFVFIDEAGGFGSGGFKSIVGGFITGLTYGELVKRTDTLLREVSAQANYPFQPDHIHLAPLLHPGANGIGRVSQSFFKIPEKARRMLADACTSALPEFYEQCFYSKNNVPFAPGGRLQEKYVDTLIGLLKLIRIYLDDRGITGQTEVHIAPRCKVIPDEMETPNGSRKIDANAYHGELANYLRMYLPECTIRCNKSREVGLQWADVACYRMREHANGKPQKAIRADCLQTTVAYKDEGHVFSFCEHLLKEEHYALAYEEADESAGRERVLELVARIQNPFDALAELAGLLSRVRECIRNRATDPGAMDEARKLLESLHAALDDWINPARLAEVDVHTQPACTALLLDLLDATASWHHHHGATGQAEWVERYIDAMKRLGHVLPNATERRTKLFEFVNRSHNVDINDFRFESVISLFENTVMERAAALEPGERDEPTAKALGTLGQAYAFIARTEPEYARIAEEYLRRSLPHFVPGHFYHAQTLNYLATLHWQTRDVHAGLRCLAENTHLTIYGPIPPEPAAQRDLMLKWLPIALGEAPAPYDALSILRLLGEIHAEAPVGKEVLAQLSKMVAACNVGNHPHQLLAKWLGILYLRAGRNSDAARELGRTWDIANSIVTPDPKATLAVTATAIPAFGLRAVARQRMNQAVQAREEMERLESSCEELAANSGGFARYLDEIGGQEQLFEDIKNQDIGAIARWMPFEYA